MARVLSIAVLIVGLIAVSFVLVSQGGWFKWSLLTAGALVVGPFGIVAAIFNWDFVFTDPMARPRVEKLGRSGARLFQALMGSLITALGIWSVASGFYATGARYFTDRLLGP